VRGIFPDCRKHFAGSGESIEPAFVAADGAKDIAADRHLGLRTRWKPAAPDGRSAAGMTALRSDFSGLRWSTVSVAMPATTHRARSGR
jgi:hypothetical protein